MIPKPAAFDRELEAGAVFGRAALVFVQERAVDQLDEDAAFLHELNRVGDLHELARRGLRISEGSRIDEFRGTGYRLIKSRESKTESALLTACGSAIIPIPGSANRCQFDAEFYLSVASWTLRSVP